MTHKKYLASAIVCLVALFSVGAFNAISTPTNLTITAYQDLVRFVGQGKLEVSIFSLSGQEIFSGSGQNILDWKTVQISSGVYLYKVITNDARKPQVGKLVISSRRATLAQAPVLIISTPTVGESTSAVEQQSQVLPMHSSLCTDPCSLTHSGSFIITAGTSSTIPLTINKATGQTADLIRVNTNASGGALRVDANGTVQVNSDLAGIQSRGNPSGKFSVQSLAPGGHVYTFNSNSNGSFGMADDTLGLNRWYITSAGNFGVGTVSPGAKFEVRGDSGDLLRLTNSSGNTAFRVNSSGTVYADGSYNCGLSSGCFNAGQGADVAERIDTTDQLEPGDVVELDPNKAGYFRKSRSAKSTLVAGIISTAPAVTLGNDFDNSKENWQDSRPLLALAGRVPVKVTAKFGSIQVGDLLISSPIPGYAMKCPEARQCIGAVIGKAMEPIAEGVGKIEVQVMLR